MIDISENIASVFSRVNAAAAAAGRDPSEITVIAASKMNDALRVREAFASGIEVFGENRVQEFLAKESGYLPVHKHFIGHLQTNKVKDIVGKVELIHSVDSYHLAREISKQSVKKGVVSNILIEINVGGEDSKYGFAAADAANAVSEISKLEGIVVRGLMTIPPVEEIPGGNTEFFRQLYKLFIDIKGQNTHNVNIDILSMGMSDDFVSAIECGATMVRLGTALFGKRNYNI